MLEDIINKKMYTENYTAGLSRYNTGATTGFAGIISTQTQSSRAVILHNAFIFKRAINTVLSIFYTKEPQQLQLRSLYYYNNKPLWK